MTKKCNKCEKVKPRCEFSLRALCKKDGLQNRCKACAAVYHATRKAGGFITLRKPRSAEASKRYRTKNTDKIREYQRAYQARKRTAKPNPNPKPDYYVRTKTKQDKHDELYRSILLNM